MNRHLIAAVCAFAAASPLSLRAQALDFGLGDPPITETDKDTAPATSENDAPKKEPGPAPAPADITRLLGELASDDYGTRLNASAALLDFGIDHPSLMLSALADPLFAAADSDLKIQLRMLIWNILRFDLNDKPIGFVGIQMSDSTIFEGQGRVRRTVQVLQVIPDTAAEKNGIRFGDHIVEFNGKGFDNGRPSIMFQSFIQQMTVGDPLKLLISRNGENIEMNIELGERPLNLAGTANPEIERLNARFSQFIEDESRKRGLLPDKVEAPEPAVDPSLRLLPPGR